MYKSITAIRVPLEHQKARSSTLRMWICFWMCRVNWNPLQWNRREQQRLHYCDDKLSIDACRLCCSFVLLFFCHFGTKKRPPVIPFSSSKTCHVPPNPPHHHEATGIVSSTGSWKDFSSFFLFSIWQTHLPLASLLYFFVKHTKQPNVSEGNISQVVSQCVNLCVFTLWSITPAYPSSADAASLSCFLLDGTGPADRRDDGDDVEDGRSPELLLYTTMKLVTMVTMMMPLTPWHWREGGDHGKAQVETFKTTWSHKILFQKTGLCFKSCTRWQ